MKLLPLQRAVIANHKINPQYNISVIQLHILQRKHPRDTLLF